MSEIKLLALLKSKVVVSFNGAYNLFNVHVIFKNEKRSLFMNGFVHQRKTLDGSAMAEKILKKCCSSKYHFFCNTR